MIRRMVQTVRAEMVASVHSIVAQVGEHLNPGDTLVILESMKMEIPVVVEVSGTVQVMAVAVGDVVQEGDVIAVLV
jgi:acetyl-CoA carboxylase biotin carboxyl carrier protein